jgi:hypothetical protein
MATGRVTRGRKSQDFAADFWREDFPDIRPVAASLPGEDLLETPGIWFEVKATRELNPTKALKQARTGCPEGEYPVVIARPTGYGEAKVDKWVAMMDHDEFRRLIRELFKFRTMYGTDD